jgi:hypothetical protein
MGWMAAPLILPKDLLLFVWWSTVIGAVCRALGLCASCVYSALKMVGQPRKPLEIAEMFHLSSVQFTKAFQSIFSGGAEYGQSERPTCGTGSSSLLLQHGELPTISRIHSVASLHLAAAFLKIQETAKKVSVAAEEQELCPENMPPSLAAGACLCAPSPWT